MGALVVWGVAATLWSCSDKPGALAQAADARAPVQTTLSNLPSPAAASTASGATKPAADHRVVTSALDSLSLPDVDEEEAADANQQPGNLPVQPPSTLPPEPAHNPNLSTEHSADKPSDVAIEHPVSTPMPNGHGPSTPALAPAEAAGLAAWLAAIGEPQPNEAFGEFVARIARTQLGKPYGNPPNPHGSEALRLSFRTFQCVSFVESTLAMARCLWRHDKCLDCFARELTQLRYRGGRIDGYVSRLHYYEEWLADNANRDHLEMMTQRLGGVPTPRQARYMTHHPELYGPLSDAKVFAAIAAMEARVGNMHPAVIARDQVDPILPMLQSGDVIAVTTYRSDILVSHTGFAYRHPDGSLHMVHASSAKHRVVETQRSLSDYITERTTRAGVMVARPIAPH